LGGGFTLLALGYLICEICYPVQYRTTGVWLLTSLLGIPALLALCALFVAFPPLIVLALIVAFAGNHIRKKKP
jgi:hypothetical protein